ncbi:hypothetical protein QW060_03850 [Myroides ceti]|uniref:Uncharacterized protein n=1 Tax=Paenimyroides ceti TaxID=395087 RepID=A0ABT8CQ29_9FLAO|nr:hypothetical protein [Paenimyroides ceti]MDN3706256.1 hypothetical protein [Paenimyroides ceti]
MYCFFCPYLPIGKCWQTPVTKYSKCPEPLIKQGVSLSVKIFKKQPNQLARIGRQTLPPLGVLHSEHLKAVQ